MHILLIPVTKCRFFHVLQLYRKRLKRDDARKEKDKDLHAYNSMYIFSFNIPVSEDDTSLTFWNLCTLK